MSIVHIKQIKYTQTRKTVGGRWSVQHDFTTVAYVDENEVNRCTELGTLKFFRSLGGAESLHSEQTRWGYRPVMLVSAAPDRLTRIVRTWVWDHAHPSHWECLSCDSSRKQEVGQ